MSSGPNGYIRNSLPTYNMIKQTFKEILTKIETQPNETLSRGLARKILFVELLKPRHFLVFLSLPFGIYFATKFVMDMINNEVISATWLAISNFSPSFGYIVDEISFINAFFPYQTFSLMLITLAILSWSGWTIKKQLDHILKLNHVV